MGPSTAKSCSVGGGGKGLVELAEATLPAVGRRPTVPAAAEGSLMDPP